MFGLFKIRSNKKAAIQLSISTIVIVVLAFALLGLGLAFIRGMFKQITQTTTTIQEQVKEQILEDLRTGDKKLSFPSTDVGLERRATETLALGVKNLKGTGNLNFKIEINATEAKGTAGDPTKIEFFYDQGPFTLSAANSEVYPFQVADNANAAEVYKVKIRIIEILEDASGNLVGEIYAEKTFFLNVA